MKFLNTKRLIESIPFAYLHVFPFSRRPNTLASNMPSQNCPSIKKQRVDELRALSNEKKLDYMRAQIGRILDIIIEEMGSDKEVVGTSSNYLKVRIVGCRYPVGSLIRVMVSGVEGNLLIGVPVNSA